ncbi:MAG: dienelactone hydrolase family protein, partial [Planctomycetota bacterium JB042]
MSMIPLLAPALTLAVSVLANDPAPSPALSVADTVAPPPEATEQEMLANAAYRRTTFDLSIGPPTGPSDATVRFPSPKPRGDVRNDTVVLEWYRAVCSDEEGPAPAMLVLHILNGRMRVARSVAQAFRLNGIHAFVMHMPDYGERGDARYRLKVERFEERTWQAVADARRARDVIAALPGVDGERIGLQGTSLGAFTGSLVASVDRAFDPVFLVLGGGDLPSMFEFGQRDTAKIRAQFLRAGFDLDALKATVRAVDPARLAHRLDPARTWLWSAASDQVVPHRRLQRVEIETGPEELGARSEE